MGFFRELLRALSGDPFQPGYGRNRLPRDWWKIDGFVALKPASDRAPFTDVVGESHYQNVLADQVEGRFEEGVYWDVVVRIGIVDVPTDPSAIGLTIDGRGCGFIPRAEKDALLEELAALIPPDCHGAICKGQIVGGFRDGNEQASYGLRLLLRRPLEIKTR
ncbi:hypothetical protein DFR49_3354 [Hephaestia caeni]|uniref:HIRAN domain-containing protein n=1 Tax=Hephaestia caeni TaxID=645617 RepID=A0A397NP69_9SPHN|nr:hypothetical protein [Hephaestia caeni]RIA37469.1 hypothetical protein DFR49_3354 [Hephaestia caeni]